MVRYNDRDTNPENISLCIFSALYAPSMGGVEMYTESLARALADAGCKVTIVTMNTHNAKSHERDDNVEIVRLPALNVLGGRYPLPKHNAEYRAAMERLIKSCPNYVVVNTRFYPLSLTGLSFARKLGIAPVLVEHGSAHLAMGGRITNAIVEAVEHAMTTLDKLQRPTCYAVSKKASAWLDHFGITSAGELPNAIDADRYAANASQRDFRAELGIPADALLVASAGRLIPEKGVLQLAQAAQMLGQRNANVQVAIAGAGLLEDQLTATNIPNVHLLGKLDRADLAALFAQADLYCLPSRSEGFATTLLETAACGTPAIVTNVGGTDELIPNASYGTIISDMEPDSIADALQNASNNREMLKAQGVAVGKRVREICSWKRTAELTLTACKSAQDSKRR
ncbi:glycosyltransferase family 4 protein [uncultured Senegalimassilia sp.]|uniref:glycosyltransferase family 4 protein n=1 Tax=uncultured Senegalimassilia sp. TaxID=1714350 RepID=UPI0025E46982|nr:glycosyltransferase family 4 protein [uncultured Senegalimassilia sp.]